MSKEERRVFLVWYESQKSVLSGNRHVLVTYSHSDVTVLKQACLVFRLEVMRIGNMDFESTNIASACNKFNRKRFLKLETMGLIPSGGYTCNKMFSNKAMMLLLHMEQAGGVRIIHCRNGLEYRLP